MIDRHPLKKDQLCDAYHVIGLLHCSNNCKIWQKKWTIVKSPAHTFAQQPYKRPLKMAQHKELRATSLAAAQLPEIKT
jgi:hypothetical protein